MADKFVKTKHWLAHSGIHLSGWGTTALFSLVHIALGVAFYTFFNGIVKEVSADLEIEKKNGGEWDTYAAVKESVIKQLTTVRKFSDWGFPVLFNTLVVFIATLLV